MGGCTMTVHVLFILQAMVSADQYFATEAEVSTRQGSNWDYAVEVIIAKR